MRLALLGSLGSLVSAQQLPQDFLDQLPPEAREMAQSQMDSYGQAFEEEEHQPQFSSEEFRTRPLVLEETAKDIVVDIEILRWGEVENQQSFTISLQSQPEFVDNIRLDKTQISLSPEEWAEELQLTFDVKEAASGSEGGSESGDIVFLVTSEDKTLTPPERKFIIPLRYQSGGDRSIFVTTVREDFAGTVGLYETHLECHTEEVTLFTVDPIWIFFKGFPEDQHFFYTLVGPDGEEIETKPYAPGEDFGSGVLASMEGAISPMFKVFDEFEYDSDGQSSIPWQAGTYTVKAAYQSGDSNNPYAMFMNTLEFREIGTFELVDPVLRYKGAMVVDEKRKPGHGRMSASAGGSSASYEATWTKTGMDNVKKDLGVSGSLNFDYPRELAWSRDKLSYQGHVSVSGSSTGHEGERKDSQIRLGYAQGFLIADGLATLTKLRPNGGLDQVRGSGGVDLERRPAGVNYGRFALDFTMPTFTYPHGNPKRLLGWHLRNESHLFAVIHSVNVTPSVIGGLNSGVFMAIYGSDPEGIAATSIREEGAAQEEVAEQDSSEDEAAESIAETDTSQASDDPFGDSGFGSGDSSGGTSGSGSSGRPSGSGTSGGIFDPFRGGGMTATDPVGEGEAIELPESARGPQFPEPSFSSPEDSQLADALASNDPDRIPPSHPQVAGFISQWIGEAEPPANIDPDVDLRYNEWGTLVGKAKGGYITQNYPPDAAAGMTSAEYLWSHGRGLDSLNHCQLGEWVMAQLNGETLLGCSGRFAASRGFSVPKFVGQHLDRAERLALDEGLVPVIAIGPPAPSSDLEGFIAEQNPAFGSLVKNGESVELMIYTNYVGGATVPDVSGQSVDEAESTLRESGYAMELQLGDSPPSSDLAERIQKQDPPAGTSLAGNSAVTVWVYDRYVETFQPLPPTPQFDPSFEDAFEATRLPNLVGLSANEAELLLLENAILMRRLKGPPAPKPDLSQTVQHQNPGPGAELGELEEVEVVVYDQQASEMPAPEPSSTSSSPSGASIVVPARVADLELWDGVSGKKSDSASYINPLLQTENSRPANDWVYPIGSGRSLHGATAVYGIPGEKRIAALALIWEESGDARSSDFECGQPYQAEPFWDSETITIGRVSSSNKRATVFFIAPNDLISICRLLLNDLLPQAEAMARSCR